MAREGEGNIDNTATRVLDVLLHAAFEDAILPTVYSEKKNRQFWEKAHDVRPANGRLVERSLVYSIPGCDMYGQDKNQAVKYFTCSICQREVVSGRFAAHVARCLGRKR